MLGITIVICIFLFLTTAMILSSLEKRQTLDNDLAEILDNLNERIKILEKRGR